MEKKIAPDSPEITEIVDELRREVERLAADDGSGAELGGATPLLYRLDASAVITSDRPILVKPGPLAPAKRSIKRAIRKMLRWYVEPVAVDARSFAMAARDAIRDTSISVTTLEDRLQRELAATRDRLGRLERAQTRPSEPAAHPAPAHEPGPAEGSGAPSASAHGFDYFAFEAAMRGSREEIANRQQRYLERFRDVDDILDLGCGRGEFLALLRDAGKSAQGVDLDGDMVDQCRAQGLDVIQAEGIAFLTGLPPKSLGGVFAAQVVEHLAPDRLISLLSACHRAIRPGGVVVLETINPASLSALRNFFADLTHVQPVVAETLAFLVESVGFRDVEIAFASEVPEGGRLGHVPFDPSAPAETQAASDRNVDLLNALLFAPQDYAVIARA